MEKILHPLLCGFLCLTLLAGCKPQGAQGQGAQASATSAASVPRRSELASQTPPNPPEEQTALSVLVPAGQEALGELLGCLAAEEGITLTLREAKGAEAYTAQAVAALSEENAPDLFLVQSEGDARVIGSWIFEDLTGRGVSPSFSALADIVPEPVRLLDSQKVYGLPLGYYAEGYLVDIEMLAALLGVTNTAGLLNDLNACTWAQWSQMLAALELYLQRPTSLRIQLGEGVYNTPGSRPRIAQPLRGIFAFADGTPAALMDSALAAAVYAPYNSPENWLETGEDTLREFLFPSLESLYALMDFETLHMARPEGAVFRGEDYIQREALTQEAAQSLFAEGTALLYRADSRVGLVLEQAHTRLEGRLALLPVKLAPPVLPEDEDASNASSSGSESSSSSAEGSEESDEASVPAAEETTAGQTAAAIERRNTTLWYGADSYLCMNTQSPNKAAAQSLLMRLFTTAAGLRGIAEGLYLQPYSDLLPASTLAVQVSKVASQGGSLLPASPAILESAAQILGAHVAENLMDKAEWGEEEAYDFLVTSLRALGYQVQPGQDLDERTEDG